MSNEKLLPEGWKWVKLGEVCEKVEPVKRKSKNLDEELLYLDIGGLDNLSNKILSHKTYTWENAPSRAQQIVFKNDILFSTVRTYMKNIALIESELYDSQIASSGFCVIRSDKRFTIPKFIFYYVISESFLRPLNELQTGSSYPAVRDKDVFAQPFPLPKLSTQQAIVSKIEDLFSEIDKGIETLCATQQQLRVYRQAVLKWAFEGRLTNDNLNTGELPLGWNLKPLKGVGDWKGGGTPSKANRAFWENGNILWVSPKDMKSKVIRDSIDKVTSSAVENSSTKLIPKGSVLFVVRSGILRRTLPTAITITDVTVNQDLQALTPNDGVLVDYVYWYVQAKNEEIRRDCSKDGTTVESIESSLLKKYSIPVCSKSEQKLIVQEIESRLSVTDKIEETVSHSLQHVEAIKQSILKWAFEGKL